MPATVMFPVGPAQVRAGKWTAVQNARLATILQRLDYPDLTIARDRDLYMASEAVRQLGGRIVAHEPDASYGELVNGQ